MNKNFRKQGSVKHSSATQNSISKLREALKNGGCVTYYFIEERIRFTKKNPNGETYQRKSHIKTSVNQDLLYTTRGERRSLDQVMEVLVKGKFDIGADYFTIESNS